MIPGPTLRYAEVVVSLRNYGHRGADFGASENHRDGEKPRHAVVVLQKDAKAWRAVSTETLGVWTKRQFNRARGRGGAKGRSRRGERTLGRRHWGPGKGRHAASEQGDGGDNLFCSRHQNLARRERPTASARTPEGARTPERRTVRPPWDVLTKRDRAAPTVPRV